LVLNALGLERSSATHGALLSPLEPVGILLGGALLLGEPITATRASAVILGIVGATLIVAPSGASEGSDLFGDVLMALGHLSWAIYTLAAKPLVARHDPLVVAIWGGFLSWLPILPLALREPWDTARAIPALGWVALLAFLASGVLTFAWNRALREISAGTMAAFIFVQPVVGLVIGVSALGESVGAWAILGAMLILAGVTLATLRGES
jgi:drug/metabolite transporter (DMT)-like permease